jgi:hypothetical protein
MQDLTPYSLTPYSPRLGLMRLAFVILVISCGLAVGAYYLTSSGLILKVGAHGALLIIVGVVACVASFYFYRLVCARRHLDGKERLAFLLSGLLTGIFGGLTAISFGASALICGTDYWWIGLACGLAGVISLHAGFLVALISHLKERKSRRPSVS